jgi:hypothetical protein
MPYDHNPNYEKLLGHTNHHGVRKWLLDGIEHDDIRRGLIKGCDREDAQTIRASIRRMPHDKLERGIRKWLGHDPRKTIKHKSDASLARGLARVLARKDHA